MRQRVQVNEEESFRVLHAKHHALCIWDHISSSGCTPNSPFASELASKSYLLSSSHRVSSGIAATLSRRQSLRNQGLCSHSFRYTAASNFIHLTTFSVGFQSSQNGRVVSGTVVLGNHYCFPSCPITLSNECPYVPLYSVPTRGWRPCGKTLNAVTSSPATVV